MQSDVEKKEQELRANGWTKLGNGKWKDPYKRPFENLNAAWTAFKKK